MSKGLCCLHNDDPASRNSREIDGYLQNERLRMRRQIKILLLGAGESGKSTFLKQIKIIHGQKFSAAELQEYKEIIYQNVVKGMKVLVDARNQLGISLENPSNERHERLVFSYDGGRIDSHLFAHYVTTVRSLWADRGIKEAFERRNEFQISDSVRYFYEDLPRISSEDFTPSRQDILMARKPTRTIAEHVVDINRVPFMFVDVGGQRSQRQKWFQCFADIHSILFMVSISEFDQMLLEDRRTNRLQESLNVFETLMNNRCLLQVAIILFLNKEDLLEEKIRKSDIHKYFGEFSGNCTNIDDVKRFIANMFVTCRRNDNQRQLFHFFTTAVDTKKTQLIFHSVKDVILQQNLQRLMLN